jgi:hypothetical protein
MMSKEVSVAEILDIPAKMNFTPYSTYSIDIQSAWMSTNAVKEVCIILNTKGVYELWIESVRYGQSDFVEFYDTFEEAQRYAESMVTLQVRIQ